MTATRAIDRASVVLSGLCIIHCVILPTLLATAPVVALIAGDERVHIVLAIATIALSGTVVLRAPGARRWTFLLPALGGVSLLGLGLLAENLNIDETPPTVVGGLLVAGAHLGRLLRRS